jgi:hypothetical protein
MAIGETTAGLLFRIKGDAAEALRAFKETEVAQTELQEATVKANATQEASMAAANKVGIALAASLAAVVTAGLGVGEILLHLAKQAAEYGSSIKDASEKTGLHAEDLSALKIAGDHAGVTLEQITGSIQKYSILLGEAATGTDKAQKLLIKWGIDPKNAVEDLTGALDKAFTVISSLENPSLKAAAAQDLFKDSAGQMLSVIEAAHGNLASFREECARLGLTMTDQTATAAKKFTDSMDTLSKQFKAVELQVGNELIPVFQKYTTQLSAWLNKNKGEVASWGKSVGDAIDEIVRRFKQDETDLNNLVDFIHVLLTNDEAAYQRMQKRGTTAQPAATYNVPTIDYSRPQDKPPIDIQESEQARKAREAAEKKAQDEAAKAQRERLSSLSNYYRSLIDEAKTAFETTQQIFEDQFKSGDLAAQAYLDRAQKNISAYYDFVKSKIDENAKVEDAQAKNDIDRQTAAIEKQKAVIALKRQGQIDLDKTIDTINKKLDDNEKKEELRQKRNSELLDAITEKEREAGQIYADSIEAENEKLREQEAAIRDVNKVLDEQFKTLAEQNLAHVFDTEDSQSEYGPFQSLIDGWQHFVDLVNDTGPALGDTVAAVAGMMTEAFDSFANALGNVIQQWVLTGETGPAVMKKMLATALASLAAEAAVRALWELALGFASLFFNPAEAAAHFTAAAIFGTIAGVAAVAGRAVAGDSFKNKSGSANSRGTASGAGTQPDQNPPVYSRQTATANDSGTRDSEFAIRMRLCRLAGI